MRAGTASLASGPMFSRAIATWVRKAGSGSERASARAGTAERALPPIPQNVEAASPRTRGSGSFSISTSPGTATSPRRMSSRFARPLFSASPLFRAATRPAMLAFELPPQAAKRVRLARTTGRHLRMESPGGWVRNCPQRAPRRVNGVRRRTPLGNSDSGAFLDVLRLDQVLGGVLALEPAGGGALHHLLGDPDAAVEIHARSGPDEAAHDHVLLQAAEVVHLAADGGLGEHARRLLEAGRGDEGVGGERGLGDAEEERVAGGRLLPGLAHAVVLVHEAELVHHLVDQELGVPHVLHLHPAHHLPGDDLDVLVVDVDPLQPVDLLDLVHQVALQLLLAADLQDVVGIDGTVHEGLAGLHPLALLDVDVGPPGQLVLVGLVVVAGDDNEAHEYQLPRGAHINVQEGERVKAGEPLMDGPIDPHDILKVRGEKELQRYLVDEIQEVYRLQGVNINDKHIEVITRQMMRWVKVEDVGDTEFLIDEVVDKFRFMNENDRMSQAGKKSATGHPLLLGITKASLSTDSFISAASFQETTRVLTEAAISGKVDYLRGLKENVIMGRLIPAGTGMEFYRRIRIPEEVVERPAASGLEGEYSAEYLVEPEHIKEGAGV